MSHSVDERYDVYNEREPRARVDHVCDACKDTIRRGDRYANVKVVFEGSAETIKRCLRCQRMHEHLRSAGRSEVTKPPARKPCKNRHQCTSEWTDCYTRPLELNVRRGLGVRLVDQYQHKYPAGDGPACCTFRRTVLQTYGVVRNERDAKKLAALVLRWSRETVKEFRR